MRAAVMIGIGEPDVLVVQDVPKPSGLRDKQVLVKLMAAGINPADVKMRRKGTFFPDKMPAIIGFDGAGVIEEIGPDVEQFKVGDEVYFCTDGLGANPGTYAEYIAVDERFLARKPASLSFAEAAAAPLVVITAWEALYDRAHLQEARQVLVHAGAGGVGHIAIQLAKLRNARVVTTAGSEESAQFVRGLGADHVVFYNLGDFVEPVLAWSGGHGVDVTFDTVGESTLSRSFHATKVYGDVVGIVESNWGSLDWDTARLRNLRVGFCLMLAPMLLGLVDARKHQTEILRESAILFDQGKLKVQLSKTFPLDQVAAAHRALEMGSVRGKIVLTMS